MDRPFLAESSRTGAGSEPGIDLAGGDAEEARRAARVVAGAARDPDEARLFLEMLGLDPASGLPSFPL